MDNVQRLDDSILVLIPADKNGFTGRKCPQPDCEEYFKIEFGTGRKGEGLPCHCPYCGYTAEHDQFRTKEQKKYAMSVGMREIIDTKPEDAFGMGISMKMKPGRPTPIYYYREKQLETEVVCANCTLRYSVYGVFAICPDCRQHNSIQILDKNLEVVGKMLEMATREEKVLAEKLIENALEDCVSAFDGFGRELCLVHAHKARNPTKAEKISFQNLEGARESVLDLFEIDMSTVVTAEEWQAAVMAIQKRHLISHNQGVVDQKYLDKTGDTRAVAGRKIGIDTDEVKELARIISTFAPRISASFQNLEKES